MIIFVYHSVVQVLRDRVLKYTQPAILYIYLTEQITIILESKNPSIDEF